VLETWRKEQANARFEMMKRSLVAFHGGEMNPISFCTVQAQNIFHAPARTTAGFMHPHTFAKAWRPPETVNSKS
jgi:hypothetical protein